MSASALVLALTGSAYLHAQAPPRLGFEVATVKASPPPSGDLIDINLGTIRNGKVTLTNASLSDCLKLAYGIASDTQISGPDWIKSKAIRFDVVAQSAPHTPREQSLLMLQALLEERLKLALHHEQRPLRHLALVAGKNGLKLPESTPDGAPRKPSMPGHIANNQMSMPLLATLLSRFEHETVVDETGIKGEYVVKLDWAPDDRQSPAEVGASGPSLFTAVQEQLGLRLESRKGMVDVLVVDHAEKIPAEN